jgi:hypothetical protein
MIVEVYFYKEIKLQKHKINKNMSLHSLFHTASLRALACSYSLTIFKFYLLNNFLLYIF